MCRDKELIAKVSYVLASKHRTNLILFLGDEMHTPNEIGKGIDVRTNHVSNFLSHLKKRDIVYCATPALRKGKLYGLTEDGKFVFEFIKSDNRLEMLESAKKM